MPEEQTKFRTQSDQSEEIKFPQELKFPQIASSEPNLGAAIAHASRDKNKSDITEDDMSKLQKLLVPEIESAIERVLRKHGLLKEEN